MLRWIVGSSLKFRFIVAAAAGALMFFGVQQLRHMPVDVFPEFAPPRVEIQTLALGSLRYRGGIPRHGPVGAGAQRRPGARRDPLEVRRTTVPDRDDLQARRGSPDGPAVGR